MSTSMARLIAHLVGDYCTQTNWMAQEKTSRHLPAAAHAAVYTAGFVPLTRDWRRLAVIGGTHFVIDRWRLAKHLVWAKEQLGPASRRPPHTPTGYGDDTPPYLAVWLMIALDNTLHLLINELALREPKR